MRYFVCLLVAAVALISGVEAGSQASRPQRADTIVYHFDDPQNWGGSWPVEFTCKYGCWIPPYSLSLATHVNDDGTVSSAGAYRHIYDVPRTQRWVVSAWVNAVDATEATGLEIFVRDDLTFDARSPGHRNRIEIWAEVYRRDVGPGWRRVVIGTMNILGAPDQEWTLLFINMFNPNGDPDGRWLVGQIEFSPAPDLDDQASPADLP